MPGQQLNATVTALGRLQTPEQFRNIVLRGNSDRSTLRLGDVARVELGQADYSFTDRFNGKPASGLGVASGDRRQCARHGARDQGPARQRSSRSCRAGLKAVVPFDTTPYVRKSIEEVVKTLVEAILLVFLVMCLFLQNFRATLIPTIAVPVVLLGTFGVLALAGYSINMLTMFAVVLAIGLLVDDAIVVVENVERLMSEEGLSPVEATRRSMDQITGALVGIATVLSAVFIPMAFLQGSTGVIYRQFSITIVSAMVLSVIVAIVLTPALCATLLQPVPTGEHHSERGFFRWFNQGFDGGRRRYQSVVAHILSRTGRYLLIYLALGLDHGPAVLSPADRVPAGRGSGLSVHHGADAGRRDAGAHRPSPGPGEGLLPQQEKDAVDSIFTVAGFSFSGWGQNSGIGFVRSRTGASARRSRLGMLMRSRRAP